VNIYIAFLVNHKLALLFVLIATIVNL